MIGPVKEGVGVGRQDDPVGPGARDVEVALLLAAVGLDGPGQIPERGEDLVRGRDGHGEEARQYPVLFLLREIRCRSGSVSDRLLGLRRRAGSLAVLSMAEEVFAQGSQQFDHRDVPPVLCTVASKAAVPARPVVPGHG